MGHSILDTIGNTPLVKIRNLNPNPRVKILAKLEYFNPGGSVKDRAALQMIEDGEATGQLTPGKTVIEATSGNTGIGLALVCSVKGYRLLLTMSDAVSVERQKILKARGAEILLTPGHLGTDGAIEEVYRLSLENPDRYFMTDQFNNPANWKAHYLHTAMEIWRQTNGGVTTLVAAMGTSGTLMGVQRRFKELNPEITIVGVEPYLGHKIQGLKNMKEAYRPEIFDKNRLDHKVNIDDELAFEMTRRLARIEGLFVGMSSGAAMAVACAKAEQMTGGTIVVMFPDSGERYLSTPLFAVKQKTGIKLFNTMNRRKEPLEPAIPGKLSVYSCGPTAHARIDLGACRRFVFADLLCRYLTYRGYEVKHVMNITDLDDKTIKGSQEAGQSLEAFTGGHVAAFKQDLLTLGIQPAAHYPRASEHVQQMVDMTRELVKKGYAYEKLKSLYFDISRAPDYGRLSGVDLDKIRLGATVDLDEYEKDNPRDFTLLKRARLSDLKRGISTATEWGHIRPSWHIQCTAMSMKYLGESFDIHTSGRELVFPHHENELAIARALTGKLLARCWLHCDPVIVDGKEVEAAGAGLTLGDLTEMGYSGREIRCWLLTSHYRRPVTFSEQRLINARRALKRINSAIHTLLNASGNRRLAELDQLLYDLKHGFTNAMDDDLNISAAMASIFIIVKRINVINSRQGIHPDDAARILAEFSGIDTVLKLFDFQAAADDSGIQQLIERRQAARKEHNWPMADEIRDQLRDLDIILNDPPIGRGNR